MLLHKNWQRLKISSLLNLGGKEYTHHTHVKGVKLQGAILEKKPTEKGDGGIANFIRILEFVETNLPHLENDRLEHRFCVLWFSEMVIILLKLFQIQ